MKIEEIDELLNSINPELKNIVMSEIKNRQKQYSYWRNQAANNNCDSANQKINTVISKPFIVDMLGYLPNEITDEEYWEVAISLQPYKDDIVNGKLIAFWTETVKQMIHKTLWKKVIPLKYCPDSITVYRNITNIQCGDDLESDLCKGGK